MYIYYKYAPDRYKLVVSSYVDDCVDWYTFEEVVKCLVDTLGNKFHMSFLWYAHWFMSINISQLKCHYILMDQDMCATYVVAKYLYTDTIKEDSKFH